MNKKILILSVFLLSLLAIMVFAASTQHSPTLCSGQWSYCLNAINNDANRATALATNTSNRSGEWRSYAFAIPNNAQIDKVNVRADFFATNTLGFLDVRVSGDGGLTYGPGHTFGGNTIEQTFNLDVTNDLAWTPQKLNHTNLKVKATCFKKMAPGLNPTCRLDWIPVNVTYTIN